MFFLDVLSWDTNLWATLGDFIVKNAKIEKKYFFLIENQLKKKKTQNAIRIITIICYTNVQNDYELQTLNQVVIDKIVTFHKIGPKFHIQLFLV